MWSSCFQCLAVFSSLKPMAAFFSSWSVWLFMLLHLFVCLFFWVWCICLFAVICLLYFEPFSYNLELQALSSMTTIPTTTMMKQNCKTFQSFEIKSTWLMTILLWSAANVEKCESRQLIKNLKRSSTCEYEFDLNLGMEIVNLSFRF